MRIAEFPLAQGAPQHAASLVNSVAVPGSVRLAIINGRFAAGLSDLGALPKGLRIASLRDGARDATDGLEHHLGRVFNVDTHPFAALNTSFLDDGVAIMVTTGAVVDTPIHIVVVTSGDGKPVVAHPRTLVIAGANSQVRIAQTFIGAPGDVYFNNAVAEVVVEEGAIVDFYTDQRESDKAFHVFNLQAHVEAKGVFASHAFSTGSRIMRHDIGIGLKGEGADCTMNGVYLADGDRLMDTHTSLDHAMPHCTSHEIYKGILAGKAQGGVQRPHHRARRTRRRPTRSRPTGRCCCRTTARSTRTRSSRFSPTTSSARTARRWGSSTKKRCSTCRRAA